MKSKIHELNYINKIDVSKTVILIFSTLLCVANASAQTIENEINKLSGKFAGEWAMYKLDENHETVKAMVWKDTLRTSKPIINDTLAYVNVNSVMVFDNPSIPSYKMNFIEGFKIKNRTIKSRFFEVRGTESVEIKISDNTYIVSQDITPFELKQLGIKSAIKATNTTVKVIAVENNNEIHKIKRISTITFKADSKEKTIQFVSLEGYHKRLVH